MKYGQKWRVRERAKMLTFPLEIQQFWDIDEIDESMNAPKFEYFLGNIKGYEHRSDQPKIMHSKNATGLFWRSLMILMVEERWRSLIFWVWQGLQQHFDTLLMKDEHGALCKVDFPGCQSKILRIDDSRMLKSLQTCDKSWGRTREAKRWETKQLTRLLARTPCCKQLFGEQVQCAPHVAKMKNWNSTVQPKQHITCRKVKSNKSS